MEEQHNDLFALVRKGDLEGLKEALQVHEGNGRSLSELLLSRGKKGMTPFLAACEQGHLEIV